MTVRNVDAAIIKGPYLQAVNQNSITVMWETDNVTGGFVDYGLTTAYGKRVTQSGISTIHQILLPALSSDTTYHYRVSSGGVSTANSRFRTGVGKGTAFRFLAYGDNHSNPSGHQQVCTAMDAENARFVINTGDLVGSGGDYGLWGSEFFAPSYQLFRDTPLFPVRGNHDEGGNWYLDFFSMPSGSGTELYYSFECGDTHFTILDTEQSWTPGSAQYNWLASDLDATTATWKIVAFHRPPFSSGPHAIDGEVSSLRQYLVPLFEANGVTLVLNGHDHIYERSQKDGVSYVVTGGGGAPFDSAHQHQNPYQIYARDGLLHYCLIEVEPHSFHLEAKQLDGTVFDTLDLEDQTLEEVDFTFFVWSDPHFGANDGNGWRLNCIGDMNSLPGDPYPSPLTGTVSWPDFVLVPGDLTENGYQGQWHDDDGDSNDDYITGRGLLNFPTYEVLGNHDGYSALPVVANAIAEKFGGLWYSFDHQGMHFVGLNTVGVNPMLAPEMMNWLETDLAGVGTEAPITLFFHYNPTTDSTWEPLRNALEGYNVPLLIHGHTHTPMAYTWHGYDVLGVGDNRNDVPDHRGMAVVHVTADRLQALHYDWSQNQWYSQGRIDKEVTGFPPPIPPTPPPPGTNLVRNPGAETGTFRYWVTGGNHPGQPIIDPTTDLPTPRNHSGNHRFGFSIGWQTGEVYQHQRIYVQAGHLYEAGMWAVRWDGTDDYVRMTWIDGEWGGVENLLYDVAVHREWVEYSGQSIRPTGDIITLIIRYGHTDTTYIASGHVDDIWLIEPPQTPLWMLR
jgi:predicted phosphodiesterase